MDSGNGPLVKENLSTRQLSMIVLSILRLSINVQDLSALILSFV